MRIPALCLALTMLGASLPGLASSAPVIVVALAGDSTMETTPDSSPQHGWGQYLQPCFDKGVRVLNFAKGGRSTRTFLEEGIWKKTLDSHPQYIFIQFGHNDSHTPDHHEHTDPDTEYRKNLELMVDQARAAHAIPILITPVRRRTKDDNLVPYAQVTIEVAKRKNVPVIDLHALSEQFYRTLTPDQMKALQAANGTDVTHFSVSGAQQIVEIVALQLAVAAPELAKHLVRTSAQAVRPPITGISHIVVLDEDAGATRHFYREVLGWPESMPLDPANLVHFQVGVTQYIEVRSSPSQTPPDRVALLAFATTDVQALRTYLIASGVAVPDAIMRAANGTLSFTVRDPDGYRIEFDQGGNFPAPSPVALSTHIIHAGFDVRDADASRHFYLDVLGFRPYWHGWRKDEGHVDGVDDYKSVQVANGTDWVELMLADGRNFPASDPKHNPHHFAPGVTSVLAAFESVKQRDPEMAAKAHTSEGRDGKWQLNLFDPDHTRVELMDFEPHRPPCCSPFAGAHPSNSPQL